MNSAGLGRQPPPTPTAGAVVEADVGWGTTYERFSLYRCLDDLWDKNRFQTVLEGPHDGMAGIVGLNSLTLACRGAQVTVVLSRWAEAALARRVWQNEGYAERGTFIVASSLDLGFPPASFDLVWNFNVLPQRDDGEAVLASMIRLSRRWVLVFVPNRRNYGLQLRRLQHWRAKRPWTYGDLTRMDGHWWARQMEAQGLRVHPLLYIDAPWWPDILDMGQFIADLFPFLSRWAQRMRPEQRCRWKAEDLPYFAPERHPQLQARMERWAFIERSRFSWLKPFFAHHVGVLGEKVSTTDYTDSHGV